MLAAQKYYFRAYAINTVADTGVSALVESFYTLANEPANEPSKFIATTSSTTQIDVNFSPASSISNANGYLILQKQGALPTSVPKDGTAYSVGSPIGDGIVAAIVYSANDSVEYLTSVSAGNTYFFKIFPLNWDGQHSQTLNYLNTSSKNDSSNTIVAPTVSTSPNYLNVKNDEADVKNFYFHTCDNIWPGYR